MFEQTDFEMSGDQNCTWYSAISRGEDLSISVGPSGLEIWIKEKAAQIALNDAQLLFTNQQLSHPDSGYLASEVQAKTGATHSINRLYKSTIGALGTHQLRDNFIQYDVGRSTKYAFLTDSEDPTVLLARERESLRLFAGLEFTIDGKAVLENISNRKVKRRLIALKELEDFYSGDGEKKFSKKKIVGMVATGGLVVVGGVIYYSHRAKRE